jgi:glutaredoxin
MVDRVEVCRRKETAAVGAVCARSPGALERKELAMKKLLFFALLGLAYQYSDRIRNIDFAWPDKSIARPNYSTERSDDWRARSDDWRARSDDWRARSDNRRARPDNSTARSDYSTARNDVILYATEWCGYCQKTRVLFKENNIPYVEYDIEKSERSYKEYKRLGGIGVPLLKINGKVVRGYQPQLILASMNSN